MKRAAWLAAALVAGTGLWGTEALAQAKAQFTQDSKSPTLTDTFKGMGSSSKDPIQIEADSLELKDKDSVAVFVGNVVVRQKDTVLKTARLKVYYEQKGAAAPAGGAAGAPGQNQQIRRYEAEGGVLINQKDQTVTGETGWFDLASNKAQIQRNVVITQGKNVGKGERLDVDLTTGFYTLARAVMVFEPKGEAGKP